MSVTKVRVGVAYRFDTSCRAVKTPHRGTKWSQISPRQLRRLKQSVRSMHTALARLISSFALASNPLVTKDVEESILHCVAPFLMRWTSSRRADRNWQTGWTRSVSGHHPLPRPPSSKVLVAMCDALGPFSFETVKTRWALMRMELFRAPHVAVSLIFGKGLNRHLYIAGVFR